MQPMTFTTQVQCSAANATKENKILYLMVDLSLNIFHHEEYSHELYPLIAKPLTSHSAPLIDNIVTNNGIIVNHLFDYMPMNANPLFA